jgi:SnoaL-like domain
MNESEQTELARAYVALSNAHALSFILPMFSSSANYQSSSVGEFNGPEAIGEMMAGFFERFPDVHWDVSTYHHAAVNLVEFEFIMTASEEQSGDRIERRGLEQIEFSEDGSISRISVKTG